MKTFEENLVSQGIKIGIVAARFNDFIVSRLIGGCEDTLLRHGVREEDISLAWVPGAFEIPLIASKMAKSGKFNAVIALGGGDSWQHQPLRLRVQRGVQGHCQRLPQQRRARPLRRAHHRLHRAGH